MSSAPSPSSSRLGDSWVYDNTDSSDASGEDVAHARRTPRKKSTSINVEPRSSAVRPHGAYRRGSRSSSAVPNLDLVMPAIDENMVDGSWMGPNAGRDNGPHAQTRKRPKKNSSSISPARTNGARNYARNTPGVSKIMRDQKQDSASDVWNYLLGLLGNTLEWLLDILGGTLKGLKKPITWVLTIYVFAGLFTLMQNLLTSSIYSALSPLCRIPGSSLLNLPMCQSRVDGPTIDAGAPVEFDRLMTVQSQFEDIMEQSAAGISLPLDMKRSETSIRDLRQVVTFSQLHSKNELVLEFDGFIETARIASYDLQKFNSHVGRAVDMILSTARWTQRVLDDMALKQSSRGAIPSFISDKILAPFQPLKFTEEKLLDQYIQHTRVVSDEIERLLGEAQALLLVLQNLEDRLDVIHSIALRDNIHAQGSKDEILTQLWTLLGGNRAKLGRFNNQLRLLRQVGEQRKVAWAHVSGAILKLQAMGAQLQELRERVGSAELLKDHPEVPLAVHIESIRLGVERLEQGRESAREIEKGHTRRVIDKAEEREVTFQLDG